MFQTHHHRRTTLDLTMERNYSSPRLRTGATISSWRLNGFMAVALEADILWLSALGRADAERLDSKPTRQGPR